MKQQHINFGTVKPFSSFFAFLSIMINMFHYHPTTVDKHMKSQLHTFATVSCTCQTNHTYNCSVYLAAIPHSHTSYSVHLLPRTYHMCYNPTSPISTLYTPSFTCTQNRPSLPLLLTTPNHQPDTTTPTTTPNRIMPHHHNHHTPPPAVPKPLPLPVICLTTIITTTAPYPPHTLFSLLCPHTLAI